MRIPGENAKKGNGKLRKEFGRMKTELMHGVGEKARHQSRAKAGGAGSIATEASGGTRGAAHSESVVELASMVPDW